MLSPGRRCIPHSAGMRSPRGSDEHSPRPRSTGTAAGTTVGVVRANRGSTDFVPRSSDGPRSSARLSADSTFWQAGGKRYGKRRAASLLSVPDFAASGDGIGRGHRPPPMSSTLEAGHAAMEGGPRARAGRRRGGPPPLDASGESGGGPAGGPGPVVRFICRGRGNRSGAAHGCTGAARDAQCVSIGFSSFRRCRDPAAGAAGPGRAER
jgi:hypothetical protein